MSVRGKRWIPVAAYFLGSLLLVATFPKSDGQTSHPSTSASGDIDAAAYAILFRRIAIYDKLANDADAANSPKPHLRRIVAIRLGLVGHDADILHSLASDYATEVYPIDRNVSDVVRHFHSQFPGNRIVPGIDIGSPPDLASLQLQRDIVARRYRDLLSQALNANTFKRVDSKILDDFGTSANKGITSVTVK